ncbi:TniB family NTP-binding protein [Pseudomonas aeruginosa]|uniref:TniB family NTP-binding protein n=1 Tax=Pseudomonas aeruginosa TaxID=287 RepID=UPI003747AF8C
MTEYLHLLPQFRPLMELSDADRLAAVQSRWVDYEFADKVHAMLYAKLSGHRDQPDIFLLGGSRMGKTTIIKRFIEVHAPGFINQEGYREKPVLLIEVDHPSPRQFLIEILGTSISPYNPDASVEKLFFQALHLLRECNTKMLVIDEVHTITQGTPREMTAMAGMIKRLSNKTGIAIVGVGVKFSRQLLVKDEQYANRFVTVTVPEWTPLGFRGLLKGFESFLPLRLPSKLSTKQMAMLIYEKTQGNTAKVEELLLGCARQAIITGKECIDEELLSQKKWTIDSSGIREAAP